MIANQSFSKFKKGLIFPPLHKARAKINPPKNQFPTYSCHWSYVFSFPLLTVKKREKQISLFKGREFSKMISYN